MGQGFFYVNENKMEYIHSISGSMKFESAANDILFLKGLTRLICTSENKHFLSYKNRSLYSQKYMGSWSGDQIQILGDYEEEEKLRKLFQQGKNISLEIAAMVYDQEEKDLNEIIEKAKESMISFSYIGEIALLPDCPKSILQAMESKIGSDWKNKYYKNKKDFT